MLKNKKYKIGADTLNPKIQSICIEIEKTKAKIADTTARLRELERRKTELENSDIVGLVRGMDIAPQELSAFVEAYKQEQLAKNSKPLQQEIQAISETPTKSETEDFINEE